jgi:hypothetical protein
MTDGTPHISKYHRAGTAFGKWMQDKVIFKWENNIYASVFWGAMFLVFIVGLRGLGKDVGGIDIPFFGWLVKKLIDPQTGRVAENWVFGALLVESVLLFIMGLMLWFKPEDYDKAGGTGTPTLPSESHLEIHVKGSKTQVISSLSELQQLISKAE